MHVKVTRLPGSMSGIQLHREDTVLESHGTASTRYGGTGPRGVEPRRDQGSRVREQSEGTGRTQVVGMFRSSVPPLCERCFLAVRRLMRKGTTKECQEVWTPCWEAFLEQKGSTRSRRCWQPCQCGLGGLGLRSPQRMAHAAYWATWADALPMISERLPVVATSIVTALENQGVRRCLGELSELGP